MAITDPIAAASAPWSAALSRGGLRGGAVTNGSVAPTDTGRHGHNDGNREQAILEAATTLFDASGYGRVGVDEIGQLAGISGPAIYRYFSGKDEILAALFDAAMDRLLLLCGRLPDDPFEALDRLVSAHVEFAVGDGALLSVYTREERSLAEPWRRRLHRRQREHLARWVTVLAGCYPHRSRGELEASSHAIIGMINSTSQWPGGVRRDIDPAQLLRLLVRSGVEGLGSASRPEV